VFFAYLYCLFAILTLIVCTLPPSIRFIKNEMKSLRIHLRLSTIRETKLPRARLPLPLLLRRRATPKLLLLPPNWTRRPNLGTTIATPSTVAEDVLLSVMASGPTIAAVEPDAGRKSRRMVEVPATGVRTRTMPRNWRVASTKTKILLHRQLS
jgi:hypothetical protein